MLEEVFTRILVPESPLIGDPPAVNPLAEFEADIMETHLGRAWLEALKTYHLETYTHSIGTGYIAGRAAELLGFTQHKIRLAQIAGAGHDVGKLEEVSVSTLNHKGRLQRSHEDEIKLHPEAGFDRLIGLHYDTRDISYKFAAWAALLHHAWKAPNLALDESSLRQPYPYGQFTPFQLRPYLPKTSGFGSDINFTPDEYPIFIDIAALTTIADLAQASLGLRSYQTEQPDQSPEAQEQRKIAIRESAFEEFTGFDDKAKNKLWWDTTMLAGDEYLRLIRASA